VNVTNKIKSLRPSKNSRYNQGYIDIKSCKKLFPQLQHEKIIYRSSYEKIFISWLENNNSVKYWGSECLRIPYFYIVDGKTHSYYPDYFVEMTDGTKMVVEIKPSSQTTKPINENCWLHKEYIKNMCKWKATKEFCENKGYKFKILTEKTISSL
jgi:hypothetical protein